LPNHGAVLILPDIAVRVFGWCRVLVVVHR